MLHEKIMIFCEWILKTVNVAKEAYAFLDTCSPVS